MRLLFESERYDVTMTSIVPKAFDQIVALEPDLLVIDLACHVRAGWDLLERLRADAPTLGIPVIIVSTETACLEEAQAAPSRYGGQRFISKPVDIDAMLAAVDELIG